MEENCGFGVGKVKGSPSSCYRIGPLLAWFPHCLSAGGPTFCCIFDIEVSYWLLAALHGSNLTASHPALSLVSAPGFL